MSHKHHSIICVGAGLIQFLYKSHSRLATELTIDKVLFSMVFAGFLVKRDLSTALLLGPFEEEENGIGIASDVLKVEGEDLATPRLGSEVC